MVDVKKYELRQSCHYCSYYELGDDEETCVGEGVSTCVCLSVSNSLNSQQYKTQSTVIHVVTTTASMRVKTNFVSAGFYCLYRHRQNH
jgi:hypothetical protein